MAFDVTNTFTGSTTLVASELDQNFTDIVNKLNGNLDESSLNASSSISNSQLANDDYEIVLSTTIPGVDAAVNPGHGLNNTTGGYFVVGGIPYDATDGAVSYTILGIEHMLFLGTGGGGTAMVTTLNFGNHTDGFTAIKSGISTGTANQQTRESSFTTSVATTAARPKFFVLDVTTQGVGFLDGDSWCISIKLKRANGLRA